MSRTYSLDPKAAAAAGAAQYISETGKYVGRITRAESVTSRQNTEGIELDFVTDSGLKANFLQLWTYNADGKELPSLKVLSAMMACLRLRNIEPGPIEFTDPSDGQRKTGHGFPMLMNKPIGLLLQREEYKKNDGSIGYKFNVFAPFDARTELTAGEILAQKTAPEQLGKMVANLKDRPMRARAGNAQQPAQGNSVGMDAFDDDSIPF